MAGWQEFAGLNRGYVLELYEQYRRSRVGRCRNSRDLRAMDAPGRSRCRPRMDVRATQKIVGAAQPGAVDPPLRTPRRKARSARLPAPLGDPSLLPETHNVTDDDLRALPPTLFLAADRAARRTCRRSLRRSARIYCSTTGYDYYHVFVPEERRWLRAGRESGRFRAPADPISPVALLERLTQVEVFERFLQRAFPGKTRFSIEGLDMLVPILDEVIGEAAEAGIRNILIGMAHRGRLNVMAHVLNKPYAQILAEFKEPVSSRSFREDMAWTGDVKYHAGARRAMKGGRAMDVVVSMPPNPSHLEAIDPVVEGMARAAGTVVDSPGAPTFDPTRSLPILIHGDAAFPGQGVVAETLNLSRLPGYRTGGTIHIIVNNQLGFTTGPEDVYSTSVRERARARIQDSDRARQCGRSRGLRRSRAAGVCLPRTFPTRLPDRPDRLPAARAQRRRRARVHAAADVPDGSARTRLCAKYGRGRSNRADVLQAGVADALVRKYTDELQRRHGCAQAGAGLHRAAA